MLRPHPSLSSLQQIQASDSNCRCQTEKLTWALYLPRRIRPRSCTTYRKKEDILPSPGSRDTLRGCLHPQSNTRTPQERNSSSRRSRGCSPLEIPTYRALLFSVRCHTRDTCFRRRPLPRHMLSRSYRRRASSESFTPATLTFPLFVRANMFSSPSPPPVLIYSGALCP